MKISPPTHKHATISLFGMQTGFMLAYHALPVQNPLTRVFAAAAISVGTGLAANMAVSTRWANQGINSRP